MPVIQGDSVHCCNGNFTTGNSTNRSLPNILPNCQEQRHMNIQVKRRSLQWYSRLVADVITPPLPVAKDEKARRVHWNTRTKVEIKTARQGRDKDLRLPLTGIPWRRRRAVLVLDLVSAVGMLIYRNRIDYFIAVPRIASRKSDLYPKVDLLVNQYW